MPQGAWVRKDWGCKDCRRWGGTAACDRVPYMDDRGRDRTSARRPQPERAERLAAALRANLKRRKTQARGRADTAETGERAENQSNQPNSDD